MSSFYGLEIAKTGLFVSQRGLNLVSHNVANADTEGYTRQRMAVSAIDPAVLGARLSSPGQGTIGSGARVEYIEQIRNAYADREYRRENADYTMWTTRSEELIFVESLLDEKSNNSISKTLSDFFASVSELSNDPENVEIRTNLKQSALKLTETFNHYSRQLKELENMYNDSMKTTANEINGILKSIGDYNKTIFTFELSGEKANDLRDSRNLLLDKLSGLIDITYSEDAEGRLSVFAGGTQLIDHSSVTTLEAVSGVVAGHPEHYEIRLAGTDTPLTYTSGKLEAYRALRDGDSADQFGIPRIVDILDQLARSIAEEFNAIHSEGHTQPYGTVLSHTGVNFFDVPSGDYSQLTAANFALSADILESVHNIAASDQPVKTPGSNSNAANNNIALKLAALDQKTDLPVVSNFQNYLKNIVVELAVESAHSEKIAGSQQAVMANIENRRMAAAGVSLDEEMVQMMKYQHAYSAASRLITAIDEALDILINRTGMVGR